VARRGGAAGRRWSGGGSRAPVEWRGSGWGGEEEEGSVCAAAGEGEVGFGDGWWQDEK
jgi:hypothetical protein